MKLSTKLALAFLLSIICFIATGVVCKQNISRVISAKMWVEHTQVVLSKLEAIIAKVTRVESEVRGYVVTGDKSFLDQQLVLRKSVGELISSVADLTKDNPNQQIRIPTLKSLAKSRFEQLDALVAARDESFDKAATMLTTKDGAHITESIRGLISDMEKDENVLLDNRTKEALFRVSYTETSTNYITIFATIVIGIVAYSILAKMTRNIHSLVRGTQRVSEGDYSQRIAVSSKDELGILSHSFNEMIAQLQSKTEAQNRNAWVRTGVNEIAKQLQGHRSYESIGASVLDALVPMVQAQQATLYVRESDEPGDYLRKVACYATENTEILKNKIFLGEGMLGQVAVDAKRIVLTDLPADSLVLSSSLLNSKSAQVIIQPLVFEAQVKAVLELAWIKPIEALHEELIAEIAPWIASSLNSIALNRITEELLHDAQSLNDELQAQQEELEVQQTELKLANEELESKTDTLESQNESINVQNANLEKMRQSLQLNAAELAMASKYKSEFLANMSHDLRTPLNSVLIFSDLLSDNDEDNLNEEQIEYAKCIKSAGISLLNLVNDVLDLAKIESGKVSVEVADVPIMETLREIERSFRAIAEKKDLEFKVSLAPNIPALVRTDEKRLLQVLNNLLSNAVKFTKVGEVSFLVYVVDKKPNGSTHEESFIAFVVKDSGIGIAQENQGKIFEPFQQAESSIKHEFGGTGLGLAICKEIANVLGGTIELSSNLGEGSTFCFYLPLQHQLKNESTAAFGKPPATNIFVKTAAGVSNAVKPDFPMPVLEGKIVDDRMTIKNGDRVLLVIEDDESFAHILMQTARKLEFKVIIASSGAEAILMAHKFIPDGITLDLRLPDADGWVLLDQLKTCPETRHIPIHIVSVDTQRLRGLSVGAVGFLEKPITLTTVSEAIVHIKQQIDNKASKKILIVTSNVDLGVKFVDLLSSADDLVEFVESGSKAVGKLNQQKYDCIIIALHLPDISGLDLVEMIKRLPAFLETPIIMYADQPFTEDEKSIFGKLVKTTVLKDADSPERLLHETALFLHRVEEYLPESKRKLLSKAFSTDSNLTGRKILVVDDDERNQAALMGILSKFRMELSFASSGREALDILELEPGMELVLMDIMMPILDGYETIKMIRAQPRFEKLPVIAVTAKAMNGDRRKCLEAGASDYITKPIDRAQLMSLLRVWLQKH